ncbi:hypothetical protein CRD60_03255 [Bifidobacterium aemilianum]|uniref:Uncharacterized protein n=1 Tax=Bifidobacterium aemilianum TaxID=2493120 RepID=A0A366KAB2_9BIFI|nr:DUF3000 family protein [Bifidobacterium aemilianum]RBP98172.1 hypothetical protein CRD60_03255 [Bifidobacterium aemilianum]
MADIYTFPQAVSDLQERQTEGTAARELVRPHNVPDEVWQAVLSVSLIRHLAGMSYREIPVPKAQADFGIGISMVDGMATSYQSDPMGSYRGAGTIMAMEGGGEALPQFRQAKGWISLLYRGERESGPAGWRCAAYADLPLGQLEDNPLTPSIYWDEMSGYLRRGGAMDIHGTVTLSHDTHFGLDQDLPCSGCQMRVSWTPADSSASGSWNAGEQVDVWAHFLRSAAQLDPGNRVSEDQTAV